MMFKELNSNKTKTQRTSNKFINSQVVYKTQNKRKRFYNSFI